MDYGSATLAGLPRQLLDRLQSVNNTAARLVFSVQEYDHITPLLCDLHWLRIPQRIEYRLAVLAYTVASMVLLHRIFRRSFTEYLTSNPDDGFDLRPRRHHGIGSAENASSDKRRPCIFGCGFWNSLSPAVTTSTSLTSFQRNLKTELFARSYPDA